MYIEGIFKIIPVNEYNKIKRIEAVHRYRKQIIQHKDNSQQNQWEVENLTEEAYLNKYLF